MNDNQKKWVKVIISLGFKPTDIKTKKSSDNVVYCYDQVCTDRVRFTQFHSTTNNLGFYVLNGYIYWNMDRVYVPVYSQRQIIEHFVLCLFDAAVRTGEESKAAEIKRGLNI